MSSLNAQDCNKIKLSDFLKHEIQYPKITINSFNPQTDITDGEGTAKIIHISGTVQYADSVRVYTLNKTTDVRNKKNGTYDLCKICEEAEIDNGKWEEIRKWHYAKVAAQGNEYKFAACASIKDVVKENIDVRVVAEAKKCECKDYNLIWGNKVNCEFRKKIVEIAKELWPNNFLTMANYLMAIIKFESNFNPQATNSGSTATGLIQWLESTAKGYGTTTAELKQMTAIQQLDYVKRYFEPLKNKQVEFVDFYLQVLYPASAGKSEHTVFANSKDKLTPGIGNEDSRVRSYEPNKGLDTNKDGKIMKSEIAAIMQKYVTDGESNRATTFDCGATGGTSSASNISDTPPTLTITTTIGNDTVRSGGSEEVIITVDTHGVGNASNIKVTILGLEGKREPGSWDETPAKWQGNDMRYTASPRSDTPNQWYWIPQTPAAWDGKEVKIIAQNTLNNTWSNAEYVKVAAGNTSVNEFGLVQVTKLGNPYIINYGLEDTYIYTKKDGSKSTNAKHGDDWMKPEKANALSNAVYNLVKEYPNQKIHLNDCSAYNPAYDLGHSVTGAHSRGEAFDCKFLTTNGNGSNNIHGLTQEDIKINARFIVLLKQTSCFSTFYTDNGKIPGSTHSSGHVDHLHGN